MRVNSAFTGFFTHLLVVRSGIATVLFALLFISSSFGENADRDLRAKQVNLLIRQTGHQLLLQAGDSNSRVLPVTEMKEGTFLLRFENEFVFNHDSLISLSNRLLPKTEFPSGYTVTVHDCSKGVIVYGFQVNNTSPDILACTGRNQPTGCYTIEFAFPDLYANTKQNKAESNEATESASVDNKGVNQKPQDSTTSALSSESGQRQAVPQSVQANSHRINATLEESRMTTFDFPFINLAYAGVFVLLGFTLLIGRFGKFSEASGLQSPDIETTSESVQALPELGKFLFNAKDQRLLLESEVVSLTDKECKVLKLLHQNFGELIPRETLMQEVWINEGVITGRSLDMFISKLRKKLSLDPELRITNVHGKGYRLEVLKTQVV